MNQSRLVKIIVSYYLPLIIWIGLIFYFSGQTGAVGGQMSLSVYLLRKIAHVSEYLILTLLFARVVGLYRMKNKFWLAVIILSPLIFAVTDEWHQTFVPNRDGRIQDVVIDGVGIAIGAYLLIKSKNKK